MPSITYLGNIRGPLGPQGDKGDRGLPGLIGVQAGEAVAAKLDTGAGDITIAVLGDSTGNDGNEWVALLRNKILAARPKMHGEYTLWSDTNQSYPAMTVNQAGENYLPGGVLRLTDDLFNRTSADLTGSSPDIGPVWTGGAGAFSVADQVATAKSTGGTVLTNGGRLGDQTVTLEGVTLNTTPTAAARQIQVYAKHAGASNHIWLYLNVSTTGAVSWGIFRRLAGTAQSLVTGPNTVLPTNTLKKFNMQLKVIGQVVTGTINDVSITATLSATDADAFAGATSAGFANGNSGVSPATGVTIDRFTFDVDATSQGQALRIYNGSMPGSKLEYQASRLAAMLPVAPDLVILNSGHNYGTGGELSYTTEVSSIVANIRSMYPAAGIAATSQNPEFAPWPGVSQHLRRLTALRILAFTQRWMYIPALEAFLAQSDGGRSMVMSDGIHPEPAGSVIWADAVYKTLMERTIIKPTT